MNNLMTRRQFTKMGANVTILGLAGCTATTQSDKKISTNVLSETDKTFALNYGARPNEQFPIPAVDETKLADQFRRQKVDYTTTEKTGTVIVDTQNFFLYHVEPEGKAMRYGVGLGRAGFSWKGRARIAWKRPWPTWTPPDEMIAREPELEQWSVRNGGMPPGLENPLGARALYIFEGNVDTLYRLHGTPNVASIGTAVSSGCVRLVNQDVIHLFDQVKSNSPILVV